MSPSKKKDLDPKRIKTLRWAFRMREQGVTWNDVEGALAHQQDLIHYKSGTLRADYSKYRDMVMTDAPPPPVTDEDDPKAPPFPEEWKDEIRALVTAYLQPGRTDLVEPQPPKRKPGSKEYVEERVRISGTIPSSLMATFEEDRKARGKNYSQMLEFLLTNYYRIHSLDSG